MSDVMWPASPPVDQAPSCVAAGVGTRIGEAVIELVLVACTFGFGWVGWWIISWADGQSPSKVVLHLHVVNAKDGRLASFGRMAAREALGKGVLGALGAGAIYFQLTWLRAAVVLLVLANVAIAFADKQHRTLWDRFAGTIVIDGDPPPIVSPPLVAGTEPA